MRVRFRCGALLLVVVGVGVSGCSVPWDASASTEVRAPSPSERGLEQLEPPSSASPTVQVAPEAPAVQPVPSAAALRPVVLTGDSVADVPVGAPEPALRLTELLGEPDVRHGADWYESCGSGFNSSVGWGDLTVSMDDGALLGWNVRGRDVPKNVELPFGLDVGDPLSSVVEATGAQPEYWDWFGRYVTERNGVHWWTDSDDPAAPVTGIAADFIWCD